MSFTRISNAGSSQFWVVSGNPHLFCLNIHPAAAIFIGSNVSDEAKAHAREMLGEDVHSSSHGRKSDDESENRRMGGYKATLKSKFDASVCTLQRANEMLIDPNVSDEAKEHAEEVLKEHGVY